MNIGAGCTRPGDTHIYMGTSGWVSAFLDHIYTPDPGPEDVYRRNYEVFKRLYRSNRRYFRDLNA